MHALGLHATASPGAQMRWITAAAEPDRKLHGRYRVGWFPLRAPKEPTVLSGCLPCTQTLNATLKVTMPGIRTFLEELQGPVRLLVFRVCADAALKVSMPGRVGDHIGLEPIPHKNQREGAPHVS